MLIFPNTKINIGLNITEKRADGFHNIETIFFPVSLSDILEFVETKKNTVFTNTGIVVDSSEFDNLVLKAYKLLKLDFKLPPLNIHLHKIVPLGAGLGGGSSDASFMLKALNNCFKLNLSGKELINYAQKLGSDCPFFIKNNPVFAEGTGNIFTNIELDLSSYYILLVKPDIHISTKDAFSNIKPHKPKKPLTELIKQPINKWEKIIKNDFETSIFKIYPEIKKIKDTLYDIGAIYAQLSGSGATVYGIFKNEPETNNLFKKHFLYLQKPL
ncbi:MAG: 4-(cytidine 5'-diphospho)-2-C-methyl-D-erythritol kinase [Bacteroidales bacterium]|nr:4-(cytidine 5'-diphospho)-2-C-methyl-D-erythritol kinase [Bacteroidales bacterium]